MLTPEETEKLSKVFKALDVNGDNSLTLEELRDGYCKHMGQIISETELEDLFKRADIDNSGSIDW